MYNNPYKFTSDDILFQVYAERNNLAKSGLEKARLLFSLRPTLFQSNTAC
ncbi:DUF6157 family protein [Olivibacter sp. SDN3]|nr:DUF6157 family protein [Olivibacter sp. SDN3]